MSSHTRQHTRQLNRDSRWDSKCIDQHVHADQGTGQPRYLKIQGNGENTSSYPKFDIAKCDVTKIQYTC